MGIPVSALADDELVHYASLEPEAAAELARRCANGFEPPARIEELEEELRDLDSSYEEVEGKKDRLESQIHLALALLRRARNPSAGEQLSTDELIDLAINELE